MALTVQLGFLSLFFTPCLASPSLNATWQYSENSVGNVNSTQSYALGGNKQVSLTDLMGYTANIRYSRRVVDRRTAESAVTTQNISPSLNYWLANDFFSLGISGTATERMNSQSTDTGNRTMRASLANVIRKRFWPNVSISLEQGASFDDQEPRGQDTGHQSRNLNADWDLELARISYNFNWTESTNNITESVNTGLGHFIRFDAGRSFLDNRASVAFSQQYSIQTTKNETRSDGSSAFLRIARPRLTARDYTGPALPALPSAFDPAASGLTDSNTTTAVTTVAANDNYDLVLLVELQQVDVIYLYAIDTATGLALSSPITTGWRLESNDVVDGATAWAVVANPANVSYDSNQKRFVINTGSVSGKIFLRLYQPNMTAADITEVQAWQRFSAPGQTFTREIENTNSKSNISMSIRPISGLSFSYNMSFETNKTGDDTTAFGDMEDERMGQSAGLSWRPKRPWRVNLRASESVDQPWQQPENLSRSYSLGMSANPLRSVGLSLGLGRGESFVDNIKSSTSDSLSLSASASVFRDLRASLSASMQKSVNELTGFGAESLSSGLDLNSRPTPKLTVNLSGSYSQTQSDNAASSDSIGAGLGLNWRPSEVLAVQGNASQSWSNSTSSSTASFNMSISPARKIRINLQSDFSWSSGSSTQNYVYSLNWNLSRYLALRFSGAYSITPDENPWSIAGSLRASFSGN